MSVLVLILFLTANLLWLALVVVGLPGNWLMVFTAFVAQWWYWESAAGGDRQIFSVGTLIAVVALALLGELVELLAGMAGAKRAGATRRGALGALVGGLVGALAATFMIPIPVLGSLLGAVAGAGLGAGALELSGGRNLSESLRSGVGAGVGRFWGTVGKLTAGVAIWLVIAVAAVRT